MDELFLEAAHHVADRLSSRLVFGHYTEDDIRQEIYLLCLQARESFNESRASGPDDLAQMKNFLFIHCRNKLGHMYRDKFHRNDPPCRKCSDGTPCVPGGCNEFHIWRQRNSAKASLFASAVGTDHGPHTSDRAEPPARNGVSLTWQEIEQLIEDRIPPGHRGNWLRFKAEARFPKNYRSTFIEMLREICRDIGLEVSDEQ